MSQASEQGLPLYFSKSSGETEAMWIENLGCHETLRNPCLFQQS